MNIRDPELGAETLALLERSWSSATSSLWCLDVPSRGQCGVTSLVINDVFGGDILKTSVGSAWHFYNRVDGERLDFTAAQFPEPIPYQDVVSSREEAFADTNASQYAALSDAFRAARRNRANG